VKWIETLPFSTGNLGGKFQSKVNMQRNYLIITLFAFSLLSTSEVFSQIKACVTVEWSKHFGGAKGEQANEVKQTLDSGYVVAGFSRSSNQDLTQNAGNADYWVLKLDKNGNKLWQKNFGGSGDDFATAIVQTADGGYFVVGGSTSTNGQVMGNHGEEDVWLLRLDANGGLVWAKTYGGSQNERAEALTLTSDGGVAIAGYAESSDFDVADNNGGFDYWILKVDANGLLQFEKNFGGSLADWGFDVRQTPDGGYLLSGSTFSSDGDVAANQGFYDYWLTKLDGAGNLVWQRNFGGAGEERAYAMDLTSDNGVVVAGASISSGGDVGGNNGSYDYWAIKMELTNGDLIWSSHYGGSQEDRAFSIEETEDKGFVIAGFVTSSNGDVTANYGGKDAWLVKLDANGSLLWEKNFGGTLEDRLYDLRQTFDQGFIGAGFSVSINNDLDGNYGEPDFWVIKLTSDSLVFDLGADTTLCGGETLQLSPKLENVNYLWADGSTDTTFTVTTPGAFWLEVDKGGCKARDTILVDYVSQTAVDLGADTILCEGETLVLKTGINNASFEWQDGSTAPTFEVESAGVYGVIVKKDNCEYRDTVAVDFTTVEVELGRDTLLCDGETIFLHALQTDAKFRWQDGSTQPGFLVKTPGEYSVTVSHGGCVKSDTVSIEYQLQPDTILPAYTTICENEIIRLDLSTEGAIYRWHDGSTQPAYQITAPGQYSLTLTLNGCSFFDEIDLKACENCLYVPSAFSPNFDGFNDEFAPIPVCELFDYELMVFDRWGEQVYYGNQPGAGWDGTFKGKIAVPDVFGYWISYRILNNGNLIPQSRKGGVVLVR
jgi:gliding motility-associated-like protein